MRSKLLAAVISIVTTSGLSAQVINPDPLSPRITGYTIDARLDTDEKAVYASMEAFWVNHSSDIVRDVQLHMYMNAFSSDRSTFLKKSGIGPAKDSSDYGYIKLLEFRIDDGADLLPLSSFISPDDGNPDDKTVLKVLLPSPVLPGDTLFIYSEFETRLPARINRTGYSDDFFFVAQWFPKFGVYEPAGMRYSTTGGWNCHQYHANSEFYSNHSVYDVTITLPEKYVVGTGGLLISETKPEAGSGLKTLTYRAEDIVDFAWTAWPGYAVFKDHWRHVQITLLIPPERIIQVDRQFKAVKNALEYLTDNVGPFPWPHLTFVDPPMKGAGAGGMEYTTLFTSISSYGIPSFFHFPEMVTVHEFGHAYFMGILATNEFEEPWMDEGMNSFWEARIMDHYYGENSGMLNHPLLKIPDKSISRSSYVTSGSRQVTTNNEYSWNYPHGTYGMMSYHKSPTWLYTLMGIIGEDAMNEVFREYYRKWAFKHPCAKDFIAVVNEVVTRLHTDRFGPDMDWFFDQTLYGTGICDYRVAGIDNAKVTSINGGQAYANSSDTTSENNKNFFRSVVKLERIGEVMLPVEILVRFENGDEIRESWDGKSRFHDFVYESAERVDQVHIDPDYKIRMDVNFINNSMTLDRDFVPIRRIINKMILGIQFLLSMILL
jgi:hypothetical protein